MKHTLFRESSMTEGPVLQGMLAFFLPIMLGTLLQQLYSAVDAVVLGQFVGKTALAAVGGSDIVLINLIVNFFVGLSSGASVVISQHAGAQEHVQVSRAVHTAVFLAIIVGALTMLLGTFGAPLLLPALSTPEDTLQYSKDYLVWYFAGMIPSMIYNMGSGILRALGDSKRPLLFLVVCTIVNTILDLLFVAVFKMEVAGAAIATSLSQLICAWLVIRTLQRAHGDYRLDLKKIRPDGWLLKRMLVIGLPAGISSVLYNITNVYVQKAINMLGTDTVAAWSVFWKLDGIFWPINNAIGIAVMTFAGQNYGARKKDRILQTMHVGIALHLAICALIGGFIYFTRDWTIRLFNSDPAVVEQGRVIITYLAPCYFLFSATEVLSSMMRGVGNAVKPTIITLFGACVLRLILLRQQRHADGPDPFRHVSAAPGAFVHGDLPAPEQSHHRPVLPHYLDGSVRDVPALLQIRQMAARLPAKAAGHRLTDRKSSADLICGGFLCYGFGTVRLSFAVQFTPSPVFSNVSV